MTRRGEAPGATFRALHNSRNFRLFFGGQLISQTGNWLTLLTQTLLVLKLTGDGFAVGLLTACQFGPVLVLVPFAGLVADRSDKRRLLVTVQLFAMAQSFAFATMVFLSSSPPLGLIYVLALAGGVATAFDNPARRAFVTEMVDESDVPNAVGLNSAMMTLSRVVGPALAGLLIATVGYGWCFTLDGLSYIAVIAAFRMMNTAQLRPSPVTPRSRGQVRQGLRYVVGVRDLWLPLAMMVVVGTLSYNFQVTVPLLVTRTFGGADVMIAVMFSVLAIGSFCGALASARWHDISVNRVVAGSAGFGVALVVFAVSPTLVFAYPVALLVGWSSMIFLAGSTTIMQLRADAAMRGRVLALQAMVFLGSTPIGGPIVGLICDAWGPRAGIMLGGIAALVAAGGGLLVERRGRGHGQLGDLPDRSEMAVSAGD